MARRSRAPRVKLKHRLPNAPPTFVGRGRELDSLEAALARGPVVAVTGPGGIGKTALILRLLKERFPDQVRRTVYFGIRPGEPTEQLRYDMVKVLAESAQREVDLLEVAIDPESLTEAAIDLAEDAGLWVVLDDVHHADADEMNELLTMLVSYARDSRWIVSSRMELRTDAMLGQILPVGAMEDVDLIALALALEPGRGETDIHRAVAASSGSPWLLSQYVSTGEAGVSLTRERLLENLPPEVEPFLRALAILRAPFPLPVLADLAPVPDRETLAALERRGLVSRSEEGFRLHDIVSGLLYPHASADAADRPLRLRAAAVLEATGDPEAQVEAARLLLSAGDFDALTSLLDRHAEALFAEALAPRLWRVIGEVRDPRIARHQLRCAAELGNPTALAAIRPAPDPEPEDRLAWATATYAQGEVEKAQFLATELRGDAEAHGDDALATEAALLRARCLLHDAQPELAARELGSLRPSTAELALRRDALLARCRAVARADDVDAEIAELRRRGEAALGERLDALHDLASAFYALGRREAADEIGDLVLSTPRGGRTSLLVSRKALVLRARIRLETGNVREATELLASIRPYVRTTSLLRPFVVELDALRRLVIGDLAELDAELEVALREAGRIDRASALRLATLAERLATCRSRPPPRGVSAHADDPTAASPEADVFRLTRARRALRHGESPNADAATSAPSGDSRPHAHLLAADGALLAGDPGMAVEHARRGMLEATRTGHELVRAEALTTLLDCQTMAGHHDERTATARALIDVARALGSPRYRLTAELPEAGADPGALERIASYDQVAPTAARRARALLGGRVALDRVDEAVVMALRAQAGAFQVVTVSSPPADGWQSGWGVDERRHVVWLPDGRSVDLSKKALLWRLLAELVSRGSATKEELILSVWEERSYHPGRHDPRLHMSMRKLREALEDSPGNPTRLLTTAEGYRLGGTLRRLRAPAQP